MKKKEYEHKALDDDGSPNFDALFDFEVAVYGEFPEYLDFASVVDVSQVSKEPLGVRSRDRHTRSKHSLSHQRSQRT